MTGSISAIACTDSSDGWDRVTPALFQRLPTAVLVHRGHGWNEDGVPVDPVAIGVPKRVGRVLILQAVFGTSEAARRAWIEVYSGGVRGVSVVAEALNFRVPRAGGFRVTDWALLAVDLVRFPADERAWIEDVNVRLTPAEREVQLRFDRYVTDPKSKLGVDLRAEVRLAGDEGPMDQVLRRLVEPLTDASVDP